MEYENPQTYKKYEFTPEGVGKPTTRAAPNNTRTPSPARSQSSRFKKIAVMLVIVVVLLLVALVVVSVLLGNANSRNSSAVTPKERVEDSVCKTTECIAAAARIHSCINDRVLPCDDFYQFACGRWLIENVVPDDSLNARTLDSVEEKIKINLKNLLETENYSDPSSVRQAKQFYKSCMNATLINKRDLAKALDDLGRMPMISLDGWSAEQFNLSETLSKLTMYNTGHLFSLSVVVDVKNLSRGVLHLSETHVFSIQKDPDNEKYFEFLESIIKFMNSGFDIREDFKNLKTFHGNLYKIIVEGRNKSEDSRDQYKPMSIDQLERNYIIKKFTWRQYFGAVWNYAGLSSFDMSGVNIIDTTSPQYFRRLVELINVTPERTLANYLYMNFLVSFAYGIGEQYNELVDKLMKSEYGIFSRTDKYKSCILKTFSAVGLSLSRMYVKDNFNIDSITVAQNLTHEIQDSFTGLINGTDWMYDNLKKVLTEKSEQMSTMILPKELTSDSYVDSYYNSYNFREDAFFNNSIKATVENFKHRFSLLKIGLDKRLKNNWFGHFNVFYNVLMNQLRKEIYFFRPALVAVVKTFWPNELGTLTPNLLQPPFISNNYPRYLSYGALGSMVSEGIINGLLTSDYYLDKQGSQVMIRSQVNKAIYDQKIQCFALQGSNFTPSESGNKKQFKLLHFVDIWIYFLNIINSGVGDMHEAVEGRNNSNYPVSESAGIKVAFTVYKKWQAKQGKLEQLLPSLKFDQSQLFFLSFAQLKCEKSKKEHFSNARVDHNRFSMIGALQNSPEFAKAFNCPDNSYMNPRKKCSVW